MIAGSSKACIVSFDGVISSVSEQSVYSAMHVTTMFFTTEAASSNGHGGIAKIEPCHELHDAAKRNSGLDTKHDVE